MYGRNEADHVMPFSDLSHSELMVNEPVWMVILDKQDDNDFHAFLRDYRRKAGMATDLHETGSQYYDIKEFDTHWLPKITQLQVWYI